MHGKRTWRLSTALAAIVFAGAAGTAQAATVTDTFTGGTHLNTVLSGGAVSIGAFDTGFDGTALPAGWTGGTVAGSALTVNGVLADSHVMAVAGSSLQFRATFGAEMHQHVGFGTGFAGAPWAIFSTEATTDQILVRTFDGTSNQKDVVPAIVAKPGEAHNYRIDWATNNTVTYYVDGTLVATQNVHAFVPTLPVFAQARDNDSDPITGTAALSVDSMMLRTTKTGTFTSKVLDSGDARVASMAFRPTADLPAQVTYQLRSGPTPTAGGAGWSGWVTPSAAPPRRYVQYKATLTTPDVLTSPKLTKVAVDFRIDSTAPAVTIGAITTSGKTARVPFTSDDAAATYQCSLDGGAFAACSSPASFSGLAAGPHTVAVRGRDALGNQRTASKSFTIAGVQGSDHKAPRISVPRTLKMASNGKVRLTLRCPADEAKCSVTVKLRRKGADVASKSLKIDGGESRTATLRVSRSLRHLVEDRGSLKLTVKVRVRDAAGNVYKKSKSVTLEPAGS
jgi:hypothetical protein